MRTAKTIGLVAHDARKQEMLCWVRRNAAALCSHKLVCTGTTGGLIRDMFATEFPHLCVNITRLKSGPLGGDQQMGALIAQDEIDIMVFLTDPMTTQPHDVDVKALVRLCTVYNTVLACTVATADYIVASPLFCNEYEAERYDYSNYLERQTI